MNEELKNIIGAAKNICIIPSQDNGGESVLNALAFFYTLKELGKNVNLIIEHFPEKFAFLIPSLDFISSPKNFVISIPKSKANISQVYYEKHDEHLKIHLTLDQGTLKKDDVMFYIQEAKPDLVLTLGINNFQQQLLGRLDSFGFLLDVPVVNIDNHTDNQHFGKINLVKSGALAQITLEILNEIPLPNPASENLIKRNVANCLLAGLMIHYQNFQDPKTPFEVFEICANLMKQGADRQQITDHLIKPEAPGPFIHTIKS